MNQQEVEKVIDGYMKRSRTFLSLLTKTSYVHEKAVINKLIEERRQSVSWFCSDASFLLSIDFETELPVQGKLSLSKYCPQYYLLDAQNLLAYFGFRTALRKKKMPQYPNNLFITLYLMEIINGLYERDLDAREAHIEETFDVLLTQLTKAKLKKLRISAYQNLALLREDDASLLRYEQKIKKDLFLKGDGASMKQVSFGSLRKALNLDKIDYMNEIALFVMEQCYQTILPTLFKKGFTCGGYQIGTGPRCINEEKMFQISQVGIQSYGIPPLFVDFPVLHDREVFVTPDVYLSVVRGVLASFQLKLSETSLYLVRYYLNSLAEVIIYLMGGPKKTLVDYKAILKRDGYREDYYTVRIKDQKVLLSVVSDWFKQRPFLKDSYEKSVSWVKKEMQVSQFSVDVHRLDTIRTASIRTQEKLIVEEKAMEAKPQKKIQKKEKKKVSHPVSKKEFSASVQKDGVSPSPISSLCHELKLQLSADELSIFQEIIQGNIKKATKLCRNKSLLLSVIIDKINTIALEALDDVIIEQNEVLSDYRDEITLEIL